jgi:hypothetical protein
MKYSNLNWKWNSSISFATCGEKWNLEYLISILEKNHLRLRFKRILLRKLFILNFINHWNFLLRQKNLVIGRFLNIFGHSYRFWESHREKYGIEEFDLIPSKLWKLQITTGKFYRLAMDKKLTEIQKKSQLNFLANN